MESYVYLILLVVSIVVLGSYIWYSTKNGKESMENIDNSEAIKELKDTPEGAVVSDAPALMTSDLQGISQVERQEPSDTDLTPQDLLPQDANSNVFDVQFPSSGEEQNFLDNTNLIGSNTSGPSLKNPNLQLRADPFIKKEDTGPFLQSSYEPDMYRKPIDGCTN